MGEARSKPQGIEQGNGDYAGIEDDESPGNCDGSLSVSQTVVQMWWSIVECHIGWICRSDALCSVNLVQVDILGDLRLRLKVLAG